MPEAICPRCGSSYQRPEGHRGGSASYCRPCFNAYQREYRRLHPLTEQGRKKRLEAKRRYNARHRDRLRLEARAYQTRKRLERIGITEAIYAELLRAGCAICGAMRGDERRARLLHADHDHETGRFRGLLCGRCNTGVGMFRDSAQLLAKAADYLESQ